MQNGYVFSTQEQSNYPRVLPIHEVLSQETLIADNLFELALWMGKYYSTPLRQVLKVMLPASVRKNISAKQQYYVTRLKGKEALQKESAALRLTYPAQSKILDQLLMTKQGILLTELLEKAEVTRSPVETLVKKKLINLDTIRLDRSPLVGEEYFRTEPKTLNEEQSQAFEKIVQSIEAKEFATHLLYGITGSGKTEVYLQAIDRALSLGLGAIMLVPEISLTAQTIEQFRSRFEGKIAILHHRLSQGERFDEWHRIRRGEAKIAIGPRSAIFCPMQNLGLLIVDEEHDSAYKQNDEMPSYHARDIAVMRAKMESGTVILGSATPSLESYHNAQSGKYILSKLSSRVQTAKLPKVTLVDMSKEYEKAKGYTSFSDKLIDGIKKRIALGEQTILFLNRRGYHSSLTCRGCGHLFNCPHCDLTLTFHFNENTLSCHLCNHTLSPPPSTCPQCHAQETLKYRGVGTEQIERALHAILPEVRTLRIDGDTTRHKGSHERLFRAFSTGKSDVLIGTQMIAKGLHFPSVTLVAVIGCDGSLHIPDFRSSEQVFQLITQVSGRSGRGELPGEVIIQTQMPENATILTAAKQDFELFFASELPMRESFGFPPFTHLIKYTFSSDDAQLCQEIGGHFRQQLITRLDKGGRAYVVHPLVPAGYAKIKDRFRFQFLVRGREIYPVNREVEAILQTFLLPRKVSLSIDVDPLSTFF